MWAGTPHVDRHTSCGQAHLMWTGTPHVGRALADQNALPFWQFCLVCHVSFIILLTHSVN